MTRRTLAALALVGFSAGCSSGTTNDAQKGAGSALKAEPSSVALAKVFDPKVVEGPSLRIDDVVNVADFRGCDQPPGNSAQAGNAVLQKRRLQKGAAYEHARAQYIVKEDAKPEDLTRLTDEIRVRYEKEMLTQVPVLPVLGIDSEPFSVRYMPTFSDREDEVLVHGRRLTLRVAGPTGTEERVMAYYLNYDHLAASDPSVILILAGGVNHDPAKFELDPRGNYASMLAGRLASEGWPVLVVDDNAQTIERSLSAIRAVDRAVLKRFKSVHVIGFPDPAFHFVMFHESPVASMYIVGGSLPLWTRNDSSFPKDPKYDVQVIRDKFQWADFGLATIDQHMLLAIASNAGQSGPAKAAFFVETLPILQKHPAAGQYLRVVGNDRDGDGKGDRGQACHDGDTATYRAFFRERFATDPRTGE